jgi:hypothetical protein
MKSFVIVVAILAVVLLATLAYLFTPSVYAGRTAQGVTVHFETLGEYPSDIDRIEVVQQESGQIVWRATSQGEMFQLDRFQLMPGPNISRLNPSHGRIIHASAWDRLSSLRVFQRVALHMQGRGFHFWQ